MVVARWRRKRRRWRRSGGRSSCACPLVIVVVVMMVMVVARWSFTCIILQTNQLIRSRLPHRHTISKATFARPSATTGNAICTFSSWEEPATQVSLAMGHGGVHADCYTFTWLVSRWTLSLPPLGKSECRRPPVRVCAITLTELQMLGPPVMGLHTHGISVVKNPVWTARIVEASTWSFTVDLVTQNAKVFALCLGNISALCFR